MSYNPKDVALICLRGAAYSAMGKDEPAEKDFQMALSLPTPQDFTAVDDRRAVRTIIDMAKSIEADRSNAQLFDKRGNAYSTLVQYGRAIQDYDQAIALNPYFTYYYHRGEANARLCRYSGAVADYTAALKFGGEWGLAYKQRAVAFYRLGQNEMAGSDLAKVAELHEDDAETEELLKKLKVLGTLAPDPMKSQTQDQAATPGRDLAKAAEPHGNNAGTEELLKRLKESGTSVADPTKSQAQSPARASGNQPPVETKQMALNRKVASDEHSLAGIHHLFGNEYEPALADYSNAILLSPTDSELYLRRGMVYSSLCQTEKAIEDYSRGLSYLPKDVALICLRGAAYSAMGKEAPAEQDFQMALSLPSPQDSAAVSDRSAVRTIIDIEKSINASRHSSELFVRRGDAYFTLIQYGRAIVDYDQAIAIEPNFSYYYKRGEARAKLCRYSEAVTDYTTALKLGGEWGLVYKCRAVAFYRIGQNEKAGRDLAKLTELHEDDASTEELLKKIKESGTSVADPTKSQAQVQLQAHSNDAPVEIGKTKSQP